MDMDDTNSTLADDVEVINIASQQVTQYRYVRNLTSLIASIVIIDNATATAAAITTSYINHGQ